MNTYEIIKSVIKFNKENFEKGFSTVGRIQDQVAEKGSELLEKYSPFPEQGKEAVVQWAETIRNSRQFIQVATEKSYHELENYLSVTK